MIRVENKGLKILLDHIIEIDDESFLEDLYDEELTIIDICEFIYRHLNRTLNSIDLYLEKSEVRIGEDIDFEISDKAIKAFTEKLNKKLTTVIGKNDIESIFGEIDEELTAKDIAKYLIKLIEKIIRVYFDFDDFDKYINF